MRVPSPAVTRVLCLAVALAGQALPGQNPTSAKESTPVDAATQPALDQAVSFEPDLIALFANGSDGYLLGKTRVKRTRDTGVLQGLTDSESGEIQAMAQSMLDLESLAAAVNAINGPGQAAANAERRARMLIQSALEGTLLRDLDIYDGGTRWILEDMFGPNGVMANAHRGAALVYDGMATDHVMRQDTAVRLRGYMADQHPELPDLSTKRFPLRFKIVGNDAVVGIQNRSGKTIRDCIFVIEYRPDLEEIEKQEEKNLRNLGPSFFGSAEARREGVRRWWAMQRIDKFSICYLARWKRNQRIELPLAEKLAIANVPRAGAISLWTTGGRLLDRELPMKSYKQRVRAQITKEAKEKAKRQKEERSRLPTWLGGKGR